MTTEVKKSLRAAAGVLVCIAAIGFGAIWRDHVELSSSSDKLDISNLVASTSNNTELPESKFFEDIMELLKRKYVDPISDDTKLADGAVRGMVASLGDANSLYMDPEQYRVYSNARAGKYEGIGAEVVLMRDRRNGKVQVGGEGDEEQDTRLPKLVIAAVVPGSAADKAGLKPGDWAEFVDEHWVPNSEMLDEFTALVDKVKNKKAKPEQFLQMRKQLRDLTEKSIFPIKARDRLMMGTNGVVRTQWVRGKQHIKADIEKGEWEMSGFGVQKDGSIRLTFQEGSAEKLREELAGKTEVVLDLRNNVNGDFDAMLACMKLVAPDGVYGYLITHKDEKPAPLTIQEGASKKYKLTLLVDRTTRGAAEIFAEALSSRGIAKLSGTATADNRYVVRWYTLPGKAGYTLVTAEYRTKEPKEVMASREVPANKAEGNGMLPPKKDLVPQNPEEKR